MLESDTSLLSEPVTMCPSDWVDDVVLVCRDRQALEAVLGQLGEALTHRSQSTLEAKINWVTHAVSPAPLLFRGKPAPASTSLDSLGATITLPSVARRVTATRCSSKTASRRRGADTAAVATFFGQAESRRSRGYDSWRR